jgi:hypothetical protein
MRFVGGSGRRWLGVLVCLGGAVLAGGCGARTTEVTGKVTHKGKPLVTGNVTLIASDGSAHAGTITPEGTYSISSVPVGPVKIGVTSTDPNANPAAAGRQPARGTGAPAPREKKGKAEGKAEEQPKVVGWFPIPETVMDPSKSGLTGTVEPGKPLDVTIP